MGRERSQGEERGGEGSFLEERAPNRRYWLLSLDRSVRPRPVHAPEPDPTTSLAGEGNGGIGAGAMRSPTRLAKVVERMEEAREAVLAREGSGEARRLMVASPPERKKEWAMGQGQGLGQGMGRGPVAKAKTNPERSSAETERARRGVDWRL